MKRFHVHISVEDLEANIRFYSTVFGMPPTVLKTDYAKWMVDDPRINFAISKRGLSAGIDHLGMQVESEAELTALREQVSKASISVFDQPDADCCYARSENTGQTIRKGSRGRLSTRWTQSQSMVTQTDGANWRLRIHRACEI